MISTQITRYRLKQRLLNRALTAHYKCPNPGCQSSLISSQREIGVEDSCPNCGTIFRLNPEKLQRHLQAQEQHRDDAVESAKLKKEAKKQQGLKKQLERKEKDIEVKKRLEEERLRKQDTATIEIQPTPENATRDFVEENKRGLLGCVGVVVFMFFLFLFGPHGPFQDDRDEPPPLTRVQRLRTELSVFEARRQGFIDAWANVNNKAAAVAASDLPPEEKSQQLLELTKRLNQIDEGRKDLEEELDNFIRDNPVD